MEKIAPGDKIAFNMIVRIKKPDELISRIKEDYDDDFPGLEALIKDYVADTIGDHFEGAVDAKIDLDESEKDISLKTFLVRG